MPAILGHDYLNFPYVSLEYQVPAALVLLGWYFTAQVVGSLCLRPSACHPRIEARKIPPRNPHMGQEAASGLNSQHQGIASG